MTTDRESDLKAILRRLFLGADGLVRPIWRAVLFMVLGLSVIFLTQGAARTLSAGLPRAVQSALGAGLVDAMLLLQTWFFLSVLDRRSFRTAGLWFYSGWGRELLLGAGAGAALIVLVAGSLVASGLIAYRGFSDGGAWSGIAAWGVVLFLAAAFEEIAFRGYAFQRLADSLGPLGAVAVFSGLFGVAHLKNPAATPLSTANTVLAGVLLAAAYLKTRGLWLPIGLHWAWNFSMGPILSLPVSGFKFGTTLLRTEVSGAEWLSGGAYGPEGSVVLTLFCTAAVAAVWRTRRIAPSAAMREVLE